MDRIWQWAWDRYGARYLWAFFAIATPLSLPVYFLWSFLIVSIEGSDHYAEIAAVTVVAVAGLMYMAVLPGTGPGRLVEQWAAGKDVDRARALEASYTCARGVFIRAVWSNSASTAVLGGVVGAIAGVRGRG